VWNVLFRKLVGLWTSVVVAWRIQQSKIASFWWRTKNTFFLVCLSGIKYFCSLSAAKTAKKN